MEEHEGSSVLESKTVKDDFDNVLVLIVDIGQEMLKDVGWDILF
jgi:hypothetical protein